MSDTLDQSDTRAEVEQTIRDFFASLAGESDIAFEDVATCAHRSFDVGQVFEGRSLADLITKALAEGREITWGFGPMDTKIRGDVAWSSWVNTGSAGFPPDIEPVRWLESAVLVREEGRWKVDFFHSQRAKEE